MVFGVACMSGSPVISKIECNMYILTQQNQPKKNIICGVPQGSIIGPLLFILYVNDLHRSLDKGYCLLFADDTSIFLNNKNPSKLK